MKELGLVLGDIIALRSFCTKNENDKAEREDRKKKLFERLFGNKEDSGSKTQKKSSVKNKNAPIKVYLGWQHYDKEEKRYKQLRLSRGGGTREIQLQLSSSYQYILDIAIGKFVHNGNSCKGRAEDMVFGLGNFTGEKIENTEKFTLEGYRDCNALSRVKIYLLSEAKIW